MNEAPTVEPIVVIDDDYAMRFSCRKILLKAGYIVEDFEDGASGLEAIAALKPSLVLVDLKMPGMSGMEVIARLHEIDSRIICIVITGYATIDTAVEAMKSGAYDFLPKPFSPDELRIIVKRGLERRRLAMLAHRHELERELFRRRFVTFVSHQLQSPLVAVHQYLDVLKHLGDAPGAAAKREEWLERCLRRTEELQTLIRDWLTLSRIERDFLSLHRVPLDVCEIVRHVIQGVELLASGDEIRMEARLPEDPCIVTGDRECVTVLLENLVTNAIKYNRPGGSVTVSVERLNSELAIAVEDTGCGIPEESQPFLFEEFFRVKQDGARKTSGNGLGLAISKRIVSEMGGTIGVRSQPGAGATFTVLLPEYHQREATGTYEQDEDHSDR
ncbi:MAG: hybrid sensor histidine kinase/response regulator [Bryobacteraceae bacterium]|nr:hybrid sensor histidine kinase/response regulator [Bryobacteraceae bacterium]